MPVLTDPVASRTLSSGPALPKLHRHHRARAGHAQIGQVHLAIEQAHGLVGGTHRQHRRGVLAELTGLFQCGELRQLGQELAVVDRLQRVLELQLSKEQADEIFLVDRTALCQCGVLLGAQ